MVPWDVDAFVSTGLMFKIKNSHFLFCISISTNYFDGFFVIIIIDWSLAHLMCQPNFLWKLTWMIIRSPLDLCVSYDPAKRVSWHGILRLTESCPFDFYFNHSVPCTLPSKWTQKLYFSVFVRTVPQGLFGYLTRKLVTLYWLTQFECATVHVLLTKRKMTALCHALRVFKKSFVFIDPALNNRMFTRKHWLFWRTWIGLYFYTAQHTIHRPLKHPIESKVESWSSNLRIRGFGVVPTIFYYYSP